MRLSCPTRVLRERSAGGVRDIRRGGHGEQYDGSSSAVSGRLQTISRGDGELARPSDVRIAVPLPKEITIDVGLDEPMDDAALRQRVARALSLSV